ncbi:MAG: epimerase [Actinobacteria bacterium HGW-Actinobacteria-7]|jgi:putative NADH-flavin reductase|nr:MAG: epimerase [Actinobacteria bacterium HGW-Actinobacteria-7]
MHVLVLGAAGRTGTQIVSQALSHGHRVRALVRSTPLEMVHEHLEVVTGDVMDFDSVSAAVAGVDTVISALGSGGGRDVRVFSEGAGNVVHAMAVHEVSKLVVLSAAGVFARSDPRLSLGFRAMIATVLKPVYDDLERMEQRVAASGLDWTIIRPAGLSEGPLTGNYRVSLDGSLLSKANRVSRADVASACLKAATTPVYSRATIVIAD